jgi:hypothetical protein
MIGLAAYFLPGDVTIRGKNCRDRTLSEGRGVILLRRRFVEDGNWGEESKFQSPTSDVRSRKSADGIHSIGAYAC